MIERSYSEKMNSLGSHKYGSARVTISEIYEVCKNDWLSQDAKNNEYLLLLDEDEIIKICSYRPKYCADDYDVGISIQSLEWKIP